MFQEVTGVYSNNFDGALNYKQGFPVFNTLIHANYIKNKDKLACSQLTDDDVKVCPIDYVVVRFRLEV